MILTEETKVLRFMFPWCFKKCWNPQILGPWVGISTILEKFALNGWYFFRGRHGIEDWLIRIDLPQFVPVFLQKMRPYNALHVFLKSTHYSTILFFSCIMTHRTSAGCDFLQCCHQCLLVPGLKTAEPWLNSKRIMIGPTWGFIWSGKSQEFHVISPRWLSYVEPTPSFAARRFVSCSPFKTCRTSLTTL
jgi:hypothetical protein